MNKRFALPVALCFAFCVMPARAAFINGQNYVAISDWARGSGLYGFTLKRGDEIVLTNRTTRLVFDVDPAQAEINGVRVRLSFPVANAKGVPFIAQFDLDKTVRPLLFPSRYVEPQKITTICLDPGHGGKDSGNRVGWHYEKNYTLPLALELSVELTHPVPPEVSASIYWIGGQFLGGIFIIIMNALRDDNSTPADNMTKALIFEGVVACVTAPWFFFIKAKRGRLEQDIRARYK